MQWINIINSKIFNRFTDKIFIPNQEFKLTFKSLLCTEDYETTYFG